LECFQAIKAKVLVIDNFLTVLVVAILQAQRVRKSMLLRLGALDSTYTQQHTQ